LYQWSGLGSFGGATRLDAVKPPWISRLAADAVDSVILTFRLAEVVVERDEVERRPDQTIAAVAWNQRKTR
jgi:hypothetical protein